MACPAPPVVDRIELSCLGRSVQENSPEYGYEMMVSEAFFLNATFFLHSVNIVSVSGSDHGTAKR
jgi:hypothetical protein